MSGTNAAVRNKATALIRIRKSRIRQLKLRIKGISRFAMMPPQSFRPGDKGRRWALTSAQILADQSQNQKSLRGAKHTIPMLTGGLTYDMLRITRVTLTLNDTID